jgi:hypothetical protein
LLVSHNIRFELPIWRVLYDAIPTSASQNLIVLELRDKTTVEWCALHVETGEVIWKHAVVDTDWWAGLIGFYAGKLLLHAYTGSEQPAPKQLLVVDALSGNMSWTLSGCKFEGTDGITIQTSRISSEQSLISEHWALADGNPTKSSFLQPIQESTFWKFPVIHEETSPYYSVIRQFIQKITNKTPQKAINYGEIAGHLLFFNYLYPANAITLSRSILVVNSTRTVLWNETIDSDMSRAVFDECFYSEHHIIYLKKSDELVVLKLPRP